MSENANIVKLAVDGYKNRVQKYSVADSQDTVRKALIEANNGKTTLDLRDMRDGKCSNVFSIVEQTIDAAVIDDLRANDWFTSLVDTRNLAEGDQAEFEMEDDDLFFVDLISRGNTGIRRQRIGSYTKKAINTIPHAIRIYEELSRVLSGQVDFNKMISKVSQSVQRQILWDTYDLWNNVAAEANKATAGVYFPAAGSYDENKLLELVEHVEAAADGQQATIMGTKAAIRKAKESIDSLETRDELHNMGYAGKFYGTPVVAMPQRHKRGTTDFLFDDNTLTIVANPQKPIKFVYEGNSLILPGDATANADLTQEYLYYTNYGLGLLIANNAGIGQYKFA